MADITQQIAEFLDQLVKHQRLPTSLWPQEADSHESYGLTSTDGFIALGPDIEVLESLAVQENLSATAVNWLRELEIHRALGSTNSYLVDLAQQGSIDGRICLADVQTQGRGRRGLGRNGQHRAAHDIDRPEYRRVALGGRDLPHHVTLGHDTDRSHSLSNEHTADPPLAHASADFRDRPSGIDGKDVSAHERSNRVHRPLYRQLRRFPTVSPSYTAARELGLNGRVESAALSAPQRGSGTQNVPTRHVIPPECGGRWSGSASPWFHRPARGAWRPAPAAPRHTPPCSRSPRGCESPRWQQT